MTLAASEQEKTLWGIVENINFENTGLNAGSTAKVDNFAVLIKSFQVMVKKRMLLKLLLYC